MTTHANSARTSGTTGKSNPKSPDLLTQEQQIALLFRELEISVRQQKYLTYAKIYDPLKPDEPGVYEWQRKFHDAGAKHPIRCLVAANQVGKTRSAAAEVALHAMGLYPPWWKGKRFNHGVKIFCGSTTNEKSRDIVQYALLGQVGEWGTGWVAADKIIGKPKTRQAGIPDVVDKFHVKHSSGDYSTIALKTYEQGRESWQGTGQDLCIAEGEPVQMSDGRVIPIEQVIAGNSVVSITDRGEITHCEVLAVHDNGLKECVSLYPKQGTSITLTPDHMVFRGYRKSYKIRADSADRIAQIHPGAYWPERTSDREDAWYVWAGLVVSEGSINQRKVTNGDEKTMEKAVSILPSSARCRKTVFKNNHVPDWYLYWDEFWSDFAPALSHQKQIPGWVFTSSKEKAALFLRWLYHGDGWASYKTIGYATTSELLAKQMVILLNRLGIRSSLYLRKSKTENWRDQYWVQITRSSEVSAFCDLIGIEGKESAVKNTQAVAAQRTESKKNRCRHLVRTGTGHLWSKRIARARTSKSKMRAIQECGMRRVFDLTVSGDHRYLVGTNLVSNCWFDEEPPQPIFSEGITRTVATNGIIMMTFTPLLGYTEVVFNLTHAKPDSGIYVQHATWEDVPHLTEQKKKELRATYGEHEIEARTKGVVFMAGGLIFPVTDDLLYVDPFEIPHWWPRINGIDFGMDHPTAGAFCALDSNADTFYLYDCYSQTSQTPVYHAKAMKKHGDWIPVSWPRDGLQRDKGSGQALRDVYMEHDLYLLKDNAHYQDEKGEHVEPGLLEMLDYMKTGKFKVFRGTGEPFMVEKRNYHRDEKGQIVKIRDDIISAARYAFVMRRFACTRPTQMRTSAPMSPILGRR